MNESELPPTFQEMLAVLRRERDEHARVDAVERKFAFVFVHAMRKPVKENEPEDHLGGWLRIPVSFPDNGPWGLVTIVPLPGKNGGINGDNHNPGHGNEAPCEAVEETTITAGHGPKARPSEVLPTFSG